MEAMKKLILGLFVVGIMTLSIVAIVVSNRVSYNKESSSIFGPYAYKGGYFAINIGKGLNRNENINIYGTFLYDPQANKISGKATIEFINLKTGGVTTEPGIITYTNGLLLIEDNKGHVYYRYQAKNAVEAFWKGLIAVYEYELHRHPDHWRDVTLTPRNNPRERIIGERYEISVEGFFEKQNLSVFGLLGPFNYYITRIKDPRTGTVVSVRLTVLYNGDVVFTEEVALLPNHSSVPQSQVQGQSQATSITSTTSGSSR